MKIDLTKEWCVRMARSESGTGISAGLVALDPSFHADPVSQNKEEPRIAFGRFVRLMRRQKGLSIEKLAEDAELDVVELIGIEDNLQHRPEVRTVYQLANFFSVPQDRLLQISGLTVSRNKRLAGEAVRFAARSEPTAALSADEKAALDAFVAVLSEK